jgi:acyl-CoA thioester hydrolase
MPRIKLELPSKEICSVQIPVRINDLNYGNHVGNDAFVSLIHEARVQWLAKNGFTELDCGGAGLILSSLVIEFKKESFYGDVVEIKIFSGELTRVSFELYYQLTAHRNGENVLLAFAKTDMVCFDYGLKKTVSVPEKLKEVLE